MRALKTEPKSGFDELVIASLLADDGTVLRMGLAKSSLPISLTIDDDSLRIVVWRIIDDGYIGS